MEVNIKNPLPVKLFRTERQNRYTEMDGSKQPLKPDTKTAFPTQINLDHQNL